MRIFIVVAKNRPQLFRYLSTGFAGIEMIDVLVDRRLDRDDSSPNSVTGPPSERRATPDIYDELQERGFVIVRVPG
jgi:hypothetical protein